VCPLIRELTLRVRSSVKIVCPNSVSFDTETRAGVHKSVQ